MLYTSTYFMDIGQLLPGIGKLVYAGNMLKIAFP